MKFLAGNTAQGLGLVEYSQSGFDIFGAATAPHNLFNTLYMASIFNTL